MRIVSLALLALIAASQAALADPARGVESSDLDEIASQVAEDFRDPLIDAWARNGGHLTIAVRPVAVDEVADVELAERLNQKVEAELQANSQRRFDTVPRLDLQKVQQEINDFQGTLPSQSYLDALRRYKADVLVIGTLTPAIGGYNGLSHHQSGRSWSSHSNAWRCEDSSSMGAAATLPACATSTASPKASRPSVNSIGP